jgi:hypothetical protein
MKAAHVRGRLLFGGTVSISWLCRCWPFYGVFNTGYGLAWFLGSALMGVLYDLSLPALIVFSVGAQALSLPLLIGVAKRFVKSPSPTQ